MSIRAFREFRLQSVTQTILDDPLNGFESAEEGFILELINLLRMELKAGLTKDTVGTLVRSCGFNDGRAGPTPKQAVRCLDDFTSQKRTAPTYSIAAMSDAVLCIGCIQGQIDFHDTNTGRRIGIMDLVKRKCWTMKMAPNGRLLAVGTQSGELLLFSSGDGEKFVAGPTLLKPGSLPITCIEFNKESNYISVAGSGNKITTYYLGKDSPILISEYNRKLDERCCSDPYYGVTGLS